MPAFVHSIVLRVYADMNEGFMTCSIYVGSRAQYFRTHRGETFARAAIVVWWKGFIWSLVKTVFQVHLCWGQHHLYLYSILWTEVHLGFPTTSRTRTPFPGGYQCGWGGIVDPVIHIYIYIYIHMCVCVGGFVSLSSLFI